MLATERLRSPLSAKVMVISKIKDCGGLRCIALFSAIFVIVPTARKVILLAAQNNA
jgi:hypothetical protein